MLRNLPILIIIIVIDLLCHPILAYWISDYSDGVQTIINIIYYGFPVLLYVLLVGNQLFRWRKRFRHLFSNAISFYQLIYICKFFALLVLLLLGILQLAFDLGSYIGYNSPNLSQIGYLSATIVAAIPFFLLPYGIFVNRYRYQVRKIDLEIQQLPKELDGLKIVQISDIHSGSFHDKSGFEKGVSMINNLDPDFIFFTGDLVNNRAVEMEPYAATFGKLRARFGVFSVLGNHDYGDYVAWKSPEAKVNNIQRLIEIQESMGWEVLLNENRIIKIDNATVTVIGVENYSAKLRFPKYGNLGKAYEGAEHSDLKLLLTHDPSHWRYEILKDFPDIDVTFSGHTHGMQFGIEFGNLRWSPIKYIYKEWADLYTEGQQHLYVNRGFGVLGYPGRVGILPEITLMTIKA